jgi:hypothetical protein
MKQLYLGLALLVAISQPAAAANDDQLAKELADDGLLRYGMELGQAREAIADEDDWDIAYQIATPSTFDLACRYKEELYFQARFYLGRCYFIEKRLEVAAEETEPLFTHFHDKLGEPDEATQSHDGRLAFARWSSDDREVTLTAYRRDSGLYVMTYEEFEPEVVGIARQVQERELDELPVEHDPLTGKDRPAKPE